MTVQVVQALQIGGQEGLSGKEQGGQRLVLLSRLIHSITIVAT